LVHIAVIGYGTVGSGVVELFYKNRESIVRRCGRPVDIKYILDLKDLSGDTYGHLSVGDFHRILEDPEVSIVVEAMGGLEPACRFTKSLLAAGKSVITPNKELVATHGAELLKLAASHNVNYLFEASVGGGIPIIHPLHLCLGAGEFDEIAGILNGTTNYIMTRMNRDGTAFEEALAQAQRLGYAEQNPSSDVDGHDACRKICILASIAYGRQVYPRYVHTEGIRRVRRQDVLAAGDAGYVIKLIGRAQKMGDQVLMMVSPMLVPCASQLSGVDDVYNGILVRGKDTGDVVFYGRGAGKFPTASAVIADIVDCVKADGTIHSLHWRDGDENLLFEWKNARVSYYVAAEGRCEEKLRALLGDVRVIQTGEETAVITQKAPERMFADAFSRAEGLGLHLLSHIRVAEY
jgi:homoserine dehydrogenase